jgi:hypothetical protein
MDAMLVSQHNELCIEGTRNCGCGSVGCIRLLCDDAFALLRTLRVNSSRDALRAQLMPTGVSQTVVVHVCSDLGRKRHASLAKKIYNNLPVERWPSDPDILGAVMRHVGDKKQNIVLITDEYGTPDDVSGLKALLELQGYAPQLFQGSAAQAYAASINAATFLGSTLCSTSSVVLGARLLAGLARTTVQFTKSINHVFSTVGMGGLPWNTSDNSLAMTSIFGAEDFSDHPYVASGTFGAAGGAVEAPFIAGLIPAPLPGHASYVCNYPVSLHVGDRPTAEATTSRRACFPISFKDPLRLAESMVTFYKDGICGHSSPRLCLSLFRTTCRQLQAARFIMSSSTSLNHLFRMCTVALSE